MEEKKNNAVEKVENIANEKNKKKSKKANVDKKHVKKVKMTREQKAKLKEKERVERERAMAQKRLELARIKAHKKAEKEKAKAAILRDKNRKKAELKLKKQQMKEQRQAQKAERQMHREKNKQKRKNENRGIGGWLAAVITLSVATLVLASVLTFTFLMPTAEGSMLESTYSKSFYDTVKQVDNIDVNLSKILATKDYGAMQKYLVDTAINSELAENDLQQLPLKDESKHYTTKLINQIGDFSKYLNNKLINGERLTEKDMQSLEQLYNANLMFKNSLNELVEKMGNDFSFSTLIDGGDGNLVIGGFNELQNLSVDYPELIYDGPFSDGQENRTLKGINGGQISDADAMEIFNKTFKDFNLENVMGVGQTAGEVECFNVQGESDGEILYAQISKQGGKLLMFSFAGSCNAVNISEEQAIEKGLEFLNSVDINNMKEVWINLTGNVYTINFAGEQDGVILYPDLVKVRVCAETGMVIGIEAKSYYTNHTERVIATPKFSQKQAQENLSDSIEVLTARLALVPIGTSSETLCYEFSGTYNGSTYYVYINAINGKQVEMFKVISGTEGQLLI